MGERRSSILVPLTLTGFEVKFPSASVFSFLLLLQQHVCSTLFVLYETNYVNVVMTTSQLLNQQLCHTLRLGS